MVYFLYCKYERCSSEEWYTYQYQHLRIRTLGNMM